MSSTHSLSAFAIFGVPNLSIFMDFDDFGHFCKGPVHDFSQEFTISERSFCVFVIFTEISLSERVLERSLSANLPCSFEQFFMKISVKRRFQ